MNNRINARERGLIKGALRRVFSRSDLRRQVLSNWVIVHSDSSRPRVKKWSVCEVCKQIHPTYTMAVDHIQPLVPLDSSLEEMTWDEVIDRLWCDIKNLQCICETCHDNKTAAERLERKKHKALKKGADAKPKRVKKAAKKRSTRVTPRNFDKRIIRNSRKAS